MQMDHIFSEATSSIAHVYGNVAKALEVYLKGMLPKDFLKDSSISTRVAYRHFQKHRKATLATNDIQRKQKPCMIIRPTLEIVGPNDDLFLCGTHFTNYDGAVLGPGNDIQEFIQDKRRGFGVGFRINRYRLTFDIELQLSTSYAGYDIYHYLKNTLPWDVPRYIHTPLESLIPRNILRTIARYVGIQMDDANGVSAFLRYIRAQSSYPITYMMNNASSVDEFFIYYLQNILTVFTDLSVSEAEKKNMIEEVSVVTFKATCDFNMLANYYLYGCDAIRNKIQSCIHFIDEPMNSQAYIPIFTFNFMGIDRNMELEGFSQYTNAIIRTDKDKDGQDDSFNIKPFLSEEDYQIYLDYLAHENPATLLFRAKLIKETYDLDPSLDWDINWNTLDITIHNSDPYATYRLIIYVNLNYLNSKKLEKYYPKTDQQTIDPATKHGYVTPADS